MDKNNFEGNKKEGFEVWGDDPFPSPGVELQTVSNSHLTADSIAPF